MDWSRVEVEAIVADYLQMLTLELSGQRYNKADHRRRLRAKLNGRSESSIEFKHQNISAALLDLGIPCIRGYRALPNYQALIAEVLEEQLRQQQNLDQAALAAVQQPAVVPTMLDFSSAQTEAPFRHQGVAEPVAPYVFRATRRDYLEREAENMSLGLAGEEFVVQFEHWRLVGLGRKHLADKVEHVSRTKGDGLGYDVLSFEESGEERLVEVKTTTFGKDTPFFVSRGELALSREARHKFHLYRLFDFRKQPRFFNLNGEIEKHCRLDPTTYRASFR